MTTQWYALHSKPMKEALLWGQLRLHEAECFFPCIRVKPVNPRAKKAQPYFPGYVFVRTEEEKVRQTTFLWLPGLVSVVSFGGIPSHVPDNLINAIRQRVDEINAAAEYGLSDLKPGVVVTVHQGPFKGYEAILDTRISGEARVRVLLSLLNGSQVRLELPGEHIQLVNQ